VAGREQLTGKLRKGQGYKDRADVVNLLSRFFVVSKAKVRNPTELAQELGLPRQVPAAPGGKQLEDEPEKGPLRNLHNAFKESSSTIRPRTNSPTRSRRPSRTGS